MTTTTTKTTTNHQIIYPYEYLVALYLYTLNHIFFVILNVHSSTVVVIFFLFIFLTSSCLRTQRLAYSIESGVCACVLVSMCVYCMLICFVSVFVLVCLLEKTRVG